MSKACSPAERDHISAVHVMGRLIITATGTKPSPCYDVKVERSPLLIFPPAYVVEQCLVPGRICPQMRTPYRAVGVFHTLPTESVTVYHRDGHDTVPVHVIDDPLGSTAEGAAAPAVGSGAGSLRFGNFVETGDISEITATRPARRVDATGYSSTFSFEEAFEDAVKHLPPDPHPFPDKLTSVHVEAIGAEYGGIAGLHRLFVRVSTHH